MLTERALRWSLVTIAISGLAVGVAVHLMGHTRLADLCWTLATVPVLAGLAVSIARDFLAGRLGVDAVALVSMSAALALGQPLAGAVVALMYSGGNVLEDVAVTRAESNLRSLVDRAPRVPLAAKCREFVAYVLSRQGQDNIADKGDYLPLSRATK